MQSPLDSSGSWRSLRAFLVLAASLVSAVLLFAAVAEAESGFLIGLDARQPFIDRDAQVPLGVASNMKVVSTYVAVGNRLNDP